MTAPRALEKLLTSQNRAHKQLVKERWGIPTDIKGEPLEPLLEVRGLSVSFGGIRAVNRVEFSVWERLLFDMQSF